MVDHIYGHTIWPYIWPYNVRLNFWLYGILPYIWLATMYMAANHIIWFQTIYMVIYLVWESTRNSKSVRVRASRSSSGRFSADIQANSQFFESNDISEVKQIHEDIYNTYNQKLSLPTIWENMPNNCQIYGLEPIYMVCNQIYGIWPNIWYMDIYMARKLPYIWIWPYHKKIRYGRPLLGTLY